MSVEQAGEKKIVRSPVGAVGLGVILAPHVTEKTALGSNQSTYVFRVAKDANKVQVRDAVRKRYGVGVESVRIVHTHGKERRRGPQIGWKPGFKKAIVRLKEGQSIEIQ